MPAGNPPVCGIASRNALLAIEARGNALKKAADSAARELVSQVTNLGLR